MQRMKDSFYSFRDVNPKEWRINIRGRLQAEAGDFLRNHLGETLNLFFLESSRGWFHDSKEVMKNASSDYVFFWIEDHVLLRDVNYLIGSLSELKRYNVDYLLYSFLIDEILRQFNSAGHPQSKSFIHIWRLNKRSFQKVRQTLGRDFYVISCVSITNITLFQKILSSRRPLLRRWPINLPFDFEKRWTDHFVDNLVCALPKKELFVSIDDDHGQENYSLISRGLYENRISRDQLKSIEFSGSYFGFSKRFLEISLIRVLLTYIRRFFYTLHFLLRG